MRLPKLEPDRSYGEETTRYYHGFGDTGNLDGILRSGAIQSPGRQQASQDDLVAAHLYEDVLRHVGEEIATYDFSTGEAVASYVDQHRETFLEEGQPYTSCAVASDSFEYDEAPDFLGRHMVWVSRGETEASNHARKTDLGVAQRDTGGYFELHLPEEAVLQFGLNGGVPGEIPLAFAEEIHLENVSNDESEQIWLDIVSNQYDIAVNTI